MGRNLFFCSTPINRKRIGLLSFGMVKDVRKANSRRRTRRIVCAFCTLNLIDTGLVAINFRTLTRIVFSICVAMPDFIRNVAIPFGYTFPVVVKGRLIICSASWNITGSGRTIDRFISFNRRVTARNVFSFIYYLLSIRINKACYRPGRFPIRVRFMKRVFSNQRYVILDYTLDLTQC